MTFPYRRYEVAPNAGRPSVTSVYRPVIPVRIVGPLGDAVILGLLDTGADETIFPGFLVEQLGLDIDPTATAHFRGVGGQLITVTYGTADLEVRSKRQSHRWSSRLAFFKNQPTAILGHAGFLEHFRTTFMPSKREVILGKEQK